MNRYLHYPGCSLETSAKAYRDSLLAVQEVLEIGLEEIRDWNCCGATEYVGISLTPAYALIARNLALASRQANGTKTVVAPCSACYLNLAKCDHYMRESPVLGRRVNDALAAGGLRYEAGSLEIRHLLDVLVRDVGLDAIRSRVRRPLSGLRVAPYLGCMVPRPDYELRWSDHEHPNELKQLLSALGAEVIDFPLETHCCGGHMPHIGPATAFELIRRLVEGAVHYDAHLMAAVCPMCQMNLDAYQAETNRHFGTAHRMPVVFFTQLMGFAFGIDPDALGFDTGFVSAREALVRAGYAAPPAEGAERKKRPPRPGKGKELPMPVPAGQGEE